MGNLTIKSEIIKKHLLHEIKNMDKDRFDEINEYILFETKSNKIYQYQKMDYVYGILSKELDTGKYTHDGLLSNLVQSMLYQSKRIDCLENIIEELRNEKNNMHDVNKITNFIDNIHSGHISINKKNIDINSKKNEVKYRLALFTPLTPLKNGIADYSESLILQLKNYFDIDIFIDDNYEPLNKSITDNFKIFNHHKFHEFHENYDSIIYQVGNNQNHAYMIEYILLYPGIVVLHDFKLTYLHTFLNLELQNYCLNNCETFNFPDIQENPLNKYIIDKSIGVIVHSDYSKVRILEQNLNITVEKIELFSEQIKSPDAYLLRKKYGFNNDDILIASFGFVTQTKRIPSALIAFARLKTRFPKNNIKYLIVGDIEEEQKKIIYTLIKKNNLISDVIITGFTDLEAFEEYITISDICINLRHPYGGETSATVSRILGAGKACIVNDIGAFSELPDNVCMKIDNDLSREIDQIFYSLYRLMSDMDFRNQLSINAKKYVEEKLNILKVSDDYRDFVVRCIDGNRQEDNNMLVKKAASFIAYNYFVDISNAVDYMSQSLADMILDNKGDSK
jgi:glycosyltransferase involved in cell wall biosynthesis